MDKETLSNYGWIVIAVLVLVVMIALATPFGKFVSQAVQSTTTGLFNVNQNALGAVNISVADQEFDVPGNIPTIPEGATYTTGYIPIYNETWDYWDVDDSNTVTYTAGDAFPEEPGLGDTYTYGNYQYRYNFYYHEFGASWTDNVSQNGWGVRCINNVADPGPVLESINGAPITNMSFTFDDCTALTAAPKIPNSVTSMMGTFDTCTSLTTAPEIPSSVTNMALTFWGCNSLAGTITINSTPTSYDSCLYNTRITEILGDCNIKTQILATRY